jgi:hypothetical protein
MSRRSRERGNEPMDSGTDLLQHLMSVLEHAEADLDKASQKPSNVPDYRTRIANGWKLTNVAPVTLSRHSAKASWNSWCRLLPGRIPVGGREAPSQPQLGNLDAKGHLRRLRHHLEMATLAWLFPTPCDVSCQQTIYR